MSLEIRSSAHSATRGSAGHLYATRSECLRSQPRTRPCWPLYSYRFQTCDPNKGVPRTVKPECSPSRETEMTEEHSNRTRPWPNRNRHTPTRSNYGHEFSEECVWRERGVRAGHGVAAQHETLALAAVKQSMQEKTAIAIGEHDLAATNVRERASSDFRNIA